MNLFKLKKALPAVTIAVISLALLLLPVWLPYSFAEPDRNSISPQEKLRLGERMYRDGILPSGEPLKAFVKGDLPVPGMTFTCESCHLRGGLGSFEGGVFTPPTNGAKLFNVQKVYSSPVSDGKPFKPRQIVEQTLKYYQTHSKRPVYSDQSLAGAIKNGVDSSGRILSDVMPHYILENDDMTLLVSYLKALSSQFSPGVSESTIHFATIVTDDVSSEDQDAMLAPLENFIRNKNLTNYLDPQEGIRSRSPGFRSRLMAETTLSTKTVGIRKMSLARWVLKGPPETWRSQLDEYNRNEPAFAILGGITNGEWQPIHDFCEENRIPSIFPITDYPVIAKSDWYTLYLSKGYYQEGEGAARFLNSKELSGKPVIQIVRDSREGRALSRGFQEAWFDSGRKAPLTIILKEGETLTAEFLQKELMKENPAAIVLWDGSESIKELELLALDRNRPATVLVSSSYLGKSMWDLNEQVRDFTFLTYPYGMTQLPQEKSPTSMGIKKFNAEANSVTRNRISQQSYILTLILDMALLDIRGNYYRDNLLDVTGMIMDQDVPLYERLSFGPGQRYASKGCYIVQLAKTGLVKKSSWVIH